MRARIAVVAALTALAGLAVVPQAHASGACVDVNLVVNGQTVADEHHCVELP